MKPSKYSLLVTLCLIWLGLSCANVTADEIPAENPSWLFVQEAASGTLKGPDDQHLTLTLKRVRNYTTAFTERPYRDAVDIATEKFVANFDAAFTSDPPNASLSYRLPGQARPQTLILEITSPTYDSKKGTVTYQAALVHTAVRGSSVGDPNLIALRQIKVPSRFLAPSLMIDKLCAPLVPGFGCGWLF